MRFLTLCLLIGPLALMVLPVSLSNGAGISLRMIFCSYFKIFMMERSLLVASMGP